MTVSDIALVARARGLATHLVSRQALESLAEAEDLASITRGLTRLGAVDSVAEADDVFAAERAISRTAVRQLHTLRRWQERLPGVLDVFFALEDRRSLRALLRGAAEGAPADVRLASLMPTPTLPETVLSHLARQPSASEVAALLAAAGHSGARELVTWARTPRPDLLAIDVVLMRACAVQMSAVAERGDSVLRAFVRSVIDLGNAQNALLLAADHRDVDVTSVFVPGGRWLSPSAFVSAAGAVSQKAALTVLAAATAGSPLASWLSTAVGHLELLDRAFFLDALNRLTRSARLDPLGSAPVLRTALLIATQSRDLRALAWGAVLGTPPTLRKQQLLTPR